jgi:hypothetical protein
MAIQLSGSLAITGSLLATSTITAQTLVVQTVTSSIVYSSGSNIFGNSLSNTQIMTGSVSITGSLSVNGTSSTLGTGTTNYLPKFTGTSTIGNSLVYDDGTRVFINATSAPALGSPKLFVKMGTANTYEGILVASSTNNNVVAIAHTGTQGIITTNYGTSGANTPLAFGTDGTAQMTLSTSGNLGLGVTPSAWVSTSKGFQIGSNGWASISQQHNGATNIMSNSYESSSNAFTYIASAYALRYNQNLNDGSHAWLTSTISGTAGNAISFTQAMTLNASGNLSIGNTNDTYKLDVTGTGRFRANGDSLLIIDSADNNAPILLFNKSNSNKWQIAVDRNTPVYGGASNDINFNNGTSTIFRLAYTTGAATFSSTAQDCFTINTTNSDGPVVKIQNSGTNIGFFGNAEGVTNGGATNFAIRSTNNLIFSTGGANPRMTILSGGNVGIGTTSPSDRLSVTDASTYTFNIGAASGGAGAVLYTLGSAALTFATSGSSNERMRITSAGNVGIGSSSPLAVTNFTTLTINGTNASLIEMQAGGTSYARIQASSSEMSLIARGNTPMVFYTNPGSDTERMRITSGGNVIVGNLNYAGQTTDLILTGDKVNADGYYSRLMFTNSNQSGGSSASIRGERKTSNYDTELTFYTANSQGDGSERMRITRNGDVGIGTTSPSEKLHITSPSSNVVSLVETISNAFAQYQLKGGATNPWIIGTQDTYESNGLIFRNVSDRMVITTGGNILPGANGTQDLGTSSLRWATVFTSDLSLSNGIGDYTIVEGENDLFLYNNKQNKVYKFVIEEVDPSTATPKKS